MVGEKLMHGHGVEENQTEALAWFKLAAAAGHPHSSYNLAVAQLNGLNVELEVRQLQLFEDFQKTFFRKVRRKCCSAMLLTMEWKKLGMH